MTDTVRHPLKNQTYELLADGTVRVEDHDQHKAGIFRADGRWIEGELKYADPHLLEWVGRPR